MSVYARWQRVEQPRWEGGEGPICPTCGLSAWVELGGADSPTAYHPNLDARKLPGVDIVHDFTKLPLPLHDGHADRVKMIHCINHIPRSAAKALLEDVLRVLKPGGGIYVMVTDLLFSLHRCLEDGLIDEWLVCVYGTDGTTHPFDFHYWGYSPASMEKLLTELGYVNVRQLGHVNGWEFKIQAQKPEAPQAPAIVKRATPAVSVLTTAFRPGGLDFTLAGMRDQTFRDFELIVVDRRYEKRQERVYELYKGYGEGGFPCIYVPEHRRNGKWTTFCSAWNTAIALARGEHVIFLQDWCYAPPGWIEAHLATHAGRDNRFTLCSYGYYNSPALKTKQPFDFSGQSARSIRCTDWDAVLAGDVLDEIEVFEKGLFDPAWVPDFTHQYNEVRPGLFASGIAPNDTWVHIKNESMKRDFLWRIGGLDERLERGKGPMDIDVGLRVVNAGGELYWCDAPAAFCHSVNARLICGTMPWGDLHERLEGRWSFDDGMVYNELQRQRGAFRANNLRSMEDLARELAPWREGARPVPRDLDDLAYWRREIWPDTP